MNYYTELYYKITDHYCISVSLDNRVKCEHAMIVEVFVKTKGGVRHTLGRMKLQSRFSENTETWVKEAKLRGMASPRPYRAGQRCDGTTTACAIALFANWCKANATDPVRLYAKAYPDEEPYTDEQMRETISFANWQGVDYPRVWDKEISVLLLKSLHAINHHDLANLMSLNYNIGKQ